MLALLEHAVIGSVYCGFVLKRNLWSGSVFPTTAWLHFQQICHSSLWVFLVHGQPWGLWAACKASLRDCFTCLVKSNHRTCLRGLKYPGFDWGFGYPDLENLWHVNASYAILWQLCLCGETHWASYFLKQVSMGKAWKVSREQAARCRFSSTDDVAFFQCNK